MGMLIPADQRRTADEVRDSLDLDIGNRTAKRSAFWIMLALSGVIAVAGVLVDSTATVIGAMIIAPLATPILGIGMGVVIGSAALIGRSVLYVVAGMVLIIAVGAVLVRITPESGALISNAQISGRTSPTLMDLLAAVATGLAGSIAIARRDVSAVLPGVAIAISLVPPLGVVGVCLGGGEFALAFGALILFLSNVLSLIVAVIITLFIAGYAVKKAAPTPVWRKFAYAAIAVGFVIIAIPIAINTLTSVWSHQVRTAAEQWIADTPDTEIDSVNWQGHSVLIEVRGPGELPDVADLQREVNDLLPTDPEIVVIHTLGERIEAD